MGKMWAQWGWLDPGTCCENGYPEHPLTPAEDLSGGKSFNW